jgi:hypothetical protein
MAQRRPHFAASAQNDQVTRQLGKRILHRPRRLTEPYLKLDFVYWRGHG